MHMLLLVLRLRSYQILFHVIYIIQAAYTAINTDQLVKEINMHLSAIEFKATEPNIKNFMSLSIVIDLFSMKVNLKQL